MPRYELSMILRVLDRADLKSALKRVGENIISYKGIIRDLENLGARDLPYKMTRNGITSKNGSYFVYHFDAPPTAIDLLREYFQRDVDVIRCGFTKMIEEPQKPCNLANELLPPAYRKNVQKMIADANKCKPKVFVKQTFPY